MRIKLFASVKNRHTEAICALNMKEHAQNTPIQLIHFNKHSLGSVDNAAVSLALTFMKTERL